MGSMNVFTPLQFKLKPIGAFGPCLLCDRETYFSIDGHSSTKDKIMEDLEFGKILISKEILSNVVDERFYISFGKPLRSHLLNQFSVNKLFVFKQ